MTVLDISYADNTVLCERCHDRVPDIPGEYAFCVKCEMWVCSGCWNPIRGLCKTCAELGRTWA